MATENISVKIGLDTSQFNSSIKGMAAELRALQKIDIKLLSKEDASAVISRMGDLKDEIGNVKKAINQADPGQFFQSFSTLAAPAIASISAISMGMSAFGVETEKVEAIQRKMMAVIGILSTLQTIADAGKLKGLIQQIPLQALELKNRITNALLIKQETAAVVVENGVKTTLGKTTGTLTKLQLLWNAAVAANPIMLIVAAVAALAAGVYLLSKSFKDNTKEVDESTRSMDGLIIANDDVRKSHNDMLVILAELDIQYKVLTGTMSEQEGELESLRLKHKTTLYDLGIEYQKKLIQIKADTGEFMSYLNQFGNNLWISTKEIVEQMGNLFTKTPWSLFQVPYGLTKEQKEAFKQQQKEAEQAMWDANGGYQAIWKQIETKAEQQRKAAKELQDKIIENEIKKQREKEILLAAESLQSIRKMNKDNTASLVTDEKEIAKAVRDAKLDEIKNNADIIYKVQGAIDIIQQKEINDAKIAVEKVYQAEILRIVTETNKKKKAEDDKYYEDLNKEYQVYLKEYEDYLKQGNDLFAEAEKEMDDMQKANMEFRIANGLITNETLMKNEIDSLKKSLPYITATETEKQIARQNIIDKYTDLEKQKELEKLDYLNSIGVDVTKQYQDLELQNLKAALDNKLITEEQYQIAKQAMIDKYNIVREEKQKVINEAIAAAFTILNDQIKANEEEELDNLQERSDEKTKIIDNQLANGLVSEHLAAIQREQLAKEIAEKEKAIKIKAAKQEKAMALFSIAVNTLVAVMKNLSQLGAIAGAALTPYIIASGAIQAGIVAAKPIPQFAKGTNFAPGGQAIVGEKGPEIINLPRGSQVISNNSIDSVTNNRNGVSFEQMAEYINMSFEKYNNIPVVVSEYNITETQSKVRNVRVNSEVQ